MSNMLDDRRGLLFTINGEPAPLYQVESTAWAQPANRWTEEELPPEVRARIASLRQTGQPGAFVQLVQGEVGVYVILEENIKRLPEAAAEEETAIDPSWQSESGRALSPYDIILCTRGGPINPASGQTPETQAGDCYVLKCQSWGQFFLPSAQEPEDVTTTKRVLLLLDKLHSRNFLSMCPDPESEVLPPDFGEPIPAFMPINCYVLNLSRFKRS